MFRAPVRAEGPVVSAKTVRLESSAWQMRVSSAPAVLDMVQWKVSWRLRRVSGVQRTEDEGSCRLRLAVSAAILSVAACSLRERGRMAKVTLSTVIPPKRAWRRLSCPGVVASSGYQESGRWKR